MTKVKEHMYLMFGESNLKVTFWNLLAIFVVLLGISLLGV